MAQRTAERFRDTYARPISDADRAVQREVFGKESWVRGYTTVQQADLLAERLALGSGMRLLDVGAGRGWPSLYLAQTTGCEAVITDIPETAIRSALTRATRGGLSETSTFLLANGIHLPFRGETFDAVVHTDAL